MLPLLFTTLSDRRYDSSSGLHRILHLHCTFPFYSRTASSTCGSPRCITPLRQTSCASRLFAYKRAALLFYRSHHRAARLRTHVLILRGSTSLPRHSWLYTAAPRRRDADRRAIVSRASIGSDDSRRYIYISSRIIAHSRLPTRVTACLLLVMRAPAYVAPHLSPSSHFVLTAGSLCDIRRFSFSPRLPVDRISCGSVTAAT